MMVELSCPPGYSEHPFLISHAIETPLQAVSLYLPELSEWVKNVQETRRDLGGDFMAV